MTTEFLGSAVWSRLRAEVHAAKTRCFVATAYLGAGASRLLPLPRGSVLVVDASERAVRSGQTCPADLRRLSRRGVRVFTRTDLHAKVFVIGRTAYVGSTNASNRSASTLVEAAIRTTEARTVRAARAFVVQHALQAVTPALLVELERIYRPPEVPGGAPKRRRRSATGLARSGGLRVHMEQLCEERWTEEEQSDHDEGMLVAEEKRRRGPLYRVDSFSAVRGREQRFKIGDVVQQVVDVGNGRTFLSPPGNVLYVRGRSRATRAKAFVYLESEGAKRRSLARVARALGWTVKSLRRGTRLSAARSAELLRYWRPRA